MTVLLQHHLVIEYEFNIAAQGSKCMHLALGSGEVIMAEKNTICLLIPWISISSKYNYRAVHIVFVTSRYAPVL